MPLVEIVSRPDIRTVEHAKAYVSELRDILLAIEVSDAKMEEGSMRVDANVSVRPTGSDELRTRCELKNINSVRSLGRAIEYEARRHVDLREGIGGARGEDAREPTDTSVDATLAGRSAVRRSRDCSFSATRPEMSGKSARASDGCGVARAMKSL